MKTLRILCVLGLAFLLCSAPARSIGRVYARIPNSTTSPIYNLRIKSLKATAVIHDQLSGGLIIILAVVAGSVVAAGFRSVRTPPAGLVDGVAVTPGSGPT